MDWLDTLIGAIIVLVPALFAGRYSRRPPRLITYRSHPVLISVPQEGQPNLDINSEILGVKNVGGEPESDIEIVFAGAPLVYALTPDIEHESGPKKSGRWSIKIKHLGPKEYVDISLFNAPDPLVVRGKHGKAKYFPISYKQTLPKWFDYSRNILAVIGAVAIGVYVGAQIKNQAAGQVEPESSVSTEGTE